MSKVKGNIKRVRFYPNGLPPAASFNVNSKEDARRALWRFHQLSGWYNEFDRFSGKRVVNDFITAEKPSNKP